MSGEGVPLVVGFRLGSGLPAADSYRCVGPARLAFNVEFALERGQERQLAIALQAAELAFCGEHAGGRPARAISPDSRCFTRRAWILTISIIDSGWSTRASGAGCPRCPGG